MKKKNLISLLVVGALVGTMLTGCGDDTTVSKVDEDTYTVESTEASEAETTEAETSEVETTEVETTETATTEEATTEAEEEVSDYLSENGLVVTPQGSVQMPVSLGDTSGTEIAFLPTDVTITVTDNGDGYSDTVLTRLIDSSSLSDGSEFWSWCTVFDRYTGYNFETKSSVTDVTDDSGKTYDSNSDAYLLDVNGTVYDITLTFESERPDNYHTLYTCTVHHPSDYDGVVFHIDNASSAKDAISYDEPFKMLDYDGVVTENSLFFTATDN